MVLNTLDWSIVGVFIVICLLKKEEMIHLNPLKYYYSIMKKNIIQFKKYLNINGLCLRHGYC